MQEGIIIKGVGGFYYVLTDEGTRYECVPRGRHKLRKESFLPGDRVRIGIEKDGHATLEEKLPGHNRLVRPPIANVTLLVFVMSLAHPEPNLTLLARALVLAEYKGIRPLIVWSKMDIGDIGCGREIEKKFAGTGYTFLYTSAKTGEGMDILEKELSGETSVFAGQSGVGKSTLLNCLIPGLRIKTGELGAKGTGKHITRHIELYPFRGGFVSDTPGFHRLYLPDMDPVSLQECFPEFQEFFGKCRFVPCFHNREPGCKVKEAVEKGYISRERHKQYLTFLQELEEKEKKY